MDADIAPPEGFVPHDRKSPLTAPWEPLFVRRTDEAVVLGLQARLGLKVLTVNRVLVVRRVKRGQSVPKVLRVNRVLLVCKVKQGQSVLKERSVWSVRKASRVR